MCHDCLQGYDSVPVRAGTCPNRCHYIHREKKYMNSGYLLVPALAHEGLTRDEAEIMRERFHHSRHGGFAQPARQGGYQPL
jgi:hypothetical protein